jgi:hypothetical protein
MIPLILIIVITGISMFIGSLLSPEPTWFDYYRGGIVGFFISGVILQIMNKWQRKKEEMKENGG